MADTAHPLPRPGRPASGYSQWRLIAEELRREIVDGERATGSRLPPEGELAERFEVNRHTLRRAISELAADGLVTRRQGSGTYVTDHGPLLHRIGTRTRLNESLARSGRHASGRLLGSALEPEPASPVVAHLALGDRPALRIEAVREVDGLVISRATSWFDAARVGDLETHFDATGSFTAALAAVGISDYLRATTTIGARLATAAEAADMALSPGSVVLVSRALDTLSDGTPLQYSETRFRADRVALEVEGPAPERG